MRQHAYEANPDIRSEAAKRLEYICELACLKVYDSQDPGFTEQQIFQEEPYQEALELAEIWLKQYPPKG